MAAVAADPPPGADQRVRPSLAEHVCLVLVTQGVTHGWAIGTALAPAGELGRIWTLSRPLTYRAIEGLLERRLVTRRGAPTGARRHRAVLHPTAAGRRTAAAWLDEPVAHVRDIRIELLLKLALRHRAGSLVGPLIDAQSELLVPAIDALLSDGTGDLVDLWRRESAGAARRFLAAARQVDGPAPGPHQPPEPKWSQPPSPRVTGPAPDPRSRTVSGEWSVATRAVDVGRGAGSGDPLNVPIVLASNFLSSPSGTTSEYSRDDGTPTWHAFEEAIGSLEQGRAVAFASGMAAISAVLSGLPVGSRVAAPDDVYSKVDEWLSDAEASRGWIVTRVPVADTEAWTAASADADLMWLESPSNPLLEVTDLAAVIPAATGHGAFVVVDNTFATPLVQQPLRLGADVVVHSATKYIGGHSDLLAGVTISDEKVAERLRRHRALHGATPGALEMFLALRGLRTLPLRFERAQANARRLAAFLDAHPAVRTVRYPRLPRPDADRSHATGRDDTGGFGAVISFEIDGTADDADGVCRRLRLIRSATSLGGVESTIERRAKLAGQAHIPPTLLRLAVGIEDGDDLEADLAAALAW